MATDPLLRRFQSLLDGRYAIEREIGRGGMATVYLARDLRHDRQVAIKLLQPELTTAVTAERFLREIQITARLQHPNILTLIDSGAADGLAYYVMPHVEGESLRERLIWERQLPIEQAVQIARQVANALQYAHERGVIHRDIKPENILLSAGQAIIADFGIARAVRESHQQSITQVGMPLGTPAYMSPEQVGGQQDEIDARSDLYALGCVLFEMVAGRAPFVAPTLTKVMQMQLSEPPPSVCACRTAAPEQMDAIIVRALAKDKKARFQTAQEFAEALLVVEAVETLERATPTVARRVPTPPAFTAVAPAGATPSGLKRLLVVGGGLGGVVLGLFAAQGLIREQPATPQPGALATAPAPEYLTSVGVKPLDAYGGPEVGMLSAGIGEEISAQLSKIRQLRVLSRTTMEVVKEKKWTTRQVADSLGVRYLLEGSVQQAGRMLAVTLQLIDATSDSHVWSETFQRPARDILMIRQDIAGKVVAALATQAKGLVVMGADSSSRNPEAVEARAHGLELSNTGDEEGLDEAIRSFERALAIDSTYATAAAELSDALRYYVNLGFGAKREPYATLREAIRWGERAVQLDPQLAMAWAARGAARMETWLRIEGGLADMDRAVLLAPSNATVRIYRGIALARSGRLDDALREMETAAALDPLNAATRGGGVALTALAARKYDVVIREARLAAARDPRFPGWPVIEALGHMLGGNPGQCVAMELSQFGGPVTAICLRRAGDSTRADTIVDSIEKAAMDGPVGIFTMGFLGAYYAQAGNAAKAIAWLERAYAVSPAAFDFRLLGSELFDPVRTDPAFQQGIAAIIARIRARFS
ncbi:MAG: protein kinase domain-containing protein [Gemmatimonadales bacterium]